MWKRLVSMGLLLGATSASADGLLVNGAGATFPAPLYSKWFSEYNKLHPDLKFNYQSIGSGGGIKQLTAKTVDFGATDAPMSDDELSKAAGVQHVPTVLGAVVLAYQVPGVKALRLSPQTVAGLFLGKITRWNDAALAADNPGVALPDLAVAVAHRSDGSGTSAIFTDYLAKVSPEWKAGPGVGKSVKWPVGLGGKGNEGVTGLIKSTPGAIGYIELAYASQNKLEVAALKNHDGAYVLPSVASVTAAAASVPMPDDYRVSITDAAGAASYPISAFTYLLVYRDTADAARGRAVASFLWWAEHDGQALAPALDYAPLPASVVKKVETTLKALTVEGKPALGLSN
jgi:phosphate transport system substrate-binding protein